MVRRARTRGALVRRGPRDVFAVAKASTPARVMENRAAMEISFSPAELEQLDRMFPPPSSKVPLEML